MGNLFGIIFAIVIFILRVLVENSYGSRRNVFGRYGVFGMQDDFSL